ncbi:hypothetical protein BC831DRAFT_473056 [Entophlyctis helioformis]|nr:hypothetical protein BC831DRAFT_473056 [Entophlyctis helioformis]
MSSACIGYAPLTCACDDRRLLQTNVADSTSRRLSITCLVSDWIRVNPLAHTGFVRPSAGLATHTRIHDAHCNAATASFPGDPSESGSTIQRVQRAGLLTSALAPFPTDGAAQDRYDTLLRVAEAQRHVIQEVLPILNRHGLNPFHMSQGDDTHNRANSYSADTQHAVPRTSEASQIDVDLRLTAAMRELQALRVENDALRKSLAGMQSSAAPAAATASSSPLRHANTRS